MQVIENWSGLERWTPSFCHYPESIEAVQNIINQAREQKKKVRTIGSGHSFTALCKTNDFLISLDKFQGVISIDKNNLTATVRAGTRLYKLNEILHENGLAMPNMGDINQQSIAGAIGTGTHGTGVNFGNISTQVLAITFVNGKGEIIHCSETENKEIFKAAQVSLGCLGVIVEITLQCVPTYKLEMIIDKARIEDTIDNIEVLNSENRNFEFYWFPHTEYVMTKTVNLSDEAPNGDSLVNYFHEMYVENYGFKLLCELGNTFSSKADTVSNIVAKVSGYNKKVDYSYKVFSTERIVKFNEMEYNIPIDAYKEAKRAVMKWINKHNKNIMFPVENRFVQGDDIYMSPAYKRDSAYIAFHVYSKKEFKQYFKEIERIMLDYDGRPHWGKLNQLNPEIIRDSYPMFNKFLSIRNEQDPDNVFVSTYIHDLLLA